jgi:bifunctional non-homologous end joining protein LigD
LLTVHEHGPAEFRRLHRAVGKRQEGDLALWAFDLLFARSRDIRDKPYIERKRRLAKLVGHAKTRVLRHSEHFTDGDRLLGECGKRGLEGIVSKRRDSPYRSASRRAGSR